MPRGDGTGPMGFGPMTGRAAGYCAGYPMPGFANPAVGFGWGGRGGRGGRGGGRGFGRRFWGAGYPGMAYPGYGMPAVPGFNPFSQNGVADPEMEAGALTNQIDMMEQSLKEAKERLQELQKNSE